MRPTACALALLARQPLTQTIPAPLPHMVAGSPTTVTPAHARLEGMAGIEALVAVPAVAALFLAAPAVDVAFRPARTEAVAAIVVPAVDLGAILLPSLP